MHKKSQSSLEMAAIITFMLLMMIVFLIVITDRLVEQQERRYSVMLADLADVIESELELGSAVEDGYVRQFYVQPVLRGRSYDLAMLNSFEMNTDYSKIILFFSDKPANQHVIKLPGNAVGRVLKGDNEIRKTAGVAFLNCGAEPLDYDYGMCSGLDCDAYHDSIYEDEVIACNVCCPLFDLCCPP